MPPMSSRGYPAIDPYDSAASPRHCLTNPSLQSTTAKVRGVAQLGRALGLGPRGRRFKSYRPDLFYIYVLAALTLGILLPVQAGSIYLSKPDDPSAVVLTKAAFPELHGDGISDDTAVLQRVIDQAGASGLLLLIPEGRYRISQTI